MHAWCEGEEKVVFPLQNSVVLMLLVFFFMVLNTVSFNGLIIIIIIIIIISSIKRLIELIGSLNSNTYFILVIGPLIYFFLFNSPLIELIGSQNFSTSSILVIGSLILSIFFKLTLNFNLSLQLSSWLN
jgi:hypothetical protein